MKMEDWDRAGLNPRFGTQRAWLREQIGQLDTEEVAAYALEDERDGICGRRLLVSTPLCLIDAWYGPEPEREPLLFATAVSWQEVRGVRLLSETATDKALRHGTQWRLSIDTPAVIATDTPDATALLDFWRDCFLRARRPSVEEPDEPE